MLKPLGWGRTLVSLRHSTNGCSQYSSACRRGFFRLREVLTRGVLAASATSWASVSLRIKNQQNFAYSSLTTASTLLWKILPPRIFVAALVLMWGGFALFQSATQGFAGMMVLRLFLGLSETAFAPGVTYYLSFFYSRREIGLRQALYLGAAPISTAYAGALAYGITSIKNGAIADWWVHSLLLHWRRLIRGAGHRRILFLIEGFPAIIMVPLVYYYLPDSASTAWFLTDREKTITVARAAKDGRVGNDEKLNWRDVKVGLSDPKAWIQALSEFSPMIQS